MIDAGHSEVIQNGEPKVWRFTITEYETLSEELYPTYYRSELIDGIIYRKPTTHTAHEAVVNLIVEYFYGRYQRGFTIRIKSPIESYGESVPKPDVAICEHRKDGYMSDRPDSSEIHLLIEVALSSLSYDRNKKKGNYAAAGVTHYWIANLQDDQLEVYTQPRSAEPDLPQE